MVVVFVAVYHGLKTLLIHKLEQFFPVDFLLHSWNVAQGVDTAAIKIKTTKPDQRVLYHPFMIS